MEARIGMWKLEPEHEIALYVLLVRSILGAIFQGKPEKTIRELVDVIASGSVEEARLLQIIDYEMRENGE